MAESLSFVSQAMALAICSIIWKRGSATDWIGMASETMEEAFAQLSRYARLVVEVYCSGTDRFSLRRIAGQLWIFDTRRNANDFPELTESTFARMVCSFRRAFGEPHFLKAVHVTHPAPEYRAEYDRVLRLPVVFESDKNALLADEALLSWRNPNASRYVFGILSAHVDELLKRLEQSKSTRGRVESLLIPILHTGDANMSMIASKLGLTRQTLFRRLKAEGVTFEKVLDELRHTMALNYLRGRQVSVNEAAYLVGFSAPAAFSRAFKRWTGSSPCKMRASKNNSSEITE
jgi:AraC-like DNA-binding protein